MKEHYEPMSERKACVIVFGFIALFLIFFTALFVTFPGPQPERGEAQASCACYKMICVEGKQFIVWTCGGGIAQVMDAGQGGAQPARCRGGAGE